MTPRNPDYARTIREMFARPGFMEHLGAELIRVAPGEVDIRVALRPELRQQHGFGHAGVAWSIADSAAGCAAQTLMAAGDGVMTVELKINLMAPAKGEALIARGRIERAGKRLTVVRSEVAAVENGAETPIAVALGTMMTMTGMG